MSVLKLPGSVKKPLSRSSFFRHSHILVKILWLFYQEVVVLFAEYATFPAHPEGVQQSNFECPGAGMRASKNYKNPQTLVN